MSDVFILQNQANQFLGKQKDWLDGRDPGSLFRTPHKDEAINQMVESSARDYTQRIRVLSCPLNEKGLPQIDEALLPPPMPKVRHTDDTAQQTLIPFAEADGSAGTSETDDQPLLDTTPVN